MRKAPKIEIKPEDLKILTRKAKSWTEPMQAVERAKIILLCHEGKPVNEISRNHENLSKQDY